MTCDQKSNKIKQGNTINKLTQTMLGVLLCVAMVVALMPATVAAAGEPVRSEPPPITDPPRIPEPPIIIPPYPPEWCPEKGAEILQAIETAERFLEVNPDGTLTLNMPTQAIKTIGEDIYAQLQAGLTQSNKMVSQGYLTFDQNLNPQVTEKYLQSVRTAIALDPQLKPLVSGVYAEGNTIGILTSGGGVTQVTWHWWGIRVYLSDDVADNVRNVAAVSAILATFLPPPANKIVAGALALVALAIEVANEYDTGVRITFIRHLSGGLVPVWIEAQ